MKPNLDESERLKTQLDQAQSTQDALLYFNTVISLGIDPEDLSEPDRVLFERGELDYQNFLSRQEALQRLENSFLQESQQGSLESIANKSNSPQLEQQFSFNREEQDPTDLGLSAQVSTSQDTKLDRKEAYSSNRDPRNPERSSRNYRFSSPDVFYRVCLAGQSVLNTKEREVFQIGKIISSERLTQRQQEKLRFLADCIVNDLVPGYVASSKTPLKRESLERWTYSQGKDLSSIPAYQVESAFRRAYGDARKLFSDRSSSG